MKMNCETRKNKDKETDNWETGNCFMFYKLNPQVYATQQQHDDIYFSTL